MRNKVLFAIMLAIFTLTMALCVGAESYEPDFGKVINLDGISAPTILDTTSRVRMTDGKTYPAYYIVYFSKIRRK